LVIAHLSDLHLSQFGERVTPRTLIKGQLPRMGLLARREWEDFEHVDGWSIQRWSGFRRALSQSMGLRLVDPLGVRHHRSVIAPGRGHARRVDEALRQMRVLIQVRSRASLESLCSVHLPVSQREELLRLDQHNTNLRFLEAMDEVRAASPDMVVITGDLTDDGHGYELILCTLRDYIVAGRLFAVAGNHDLSAVPPGTVHNMPLGDKAARWSAFRCAAGMKAETYGASSLVVDDVFFLGLNSSVRPSRVAWSGRGWVGKKQLAAAAHLIGQGRAARTRICCLHHHVAHLQLGPISRADPGQFAMKLLDARDVVSLLGSNDFAAVLNGHRHHGYHVHESNLPHVVSSPSTTLGCRASKARYFWLVSVGDTGLQIERRHIGMANAPVAP
jgi:3',5'-cyclic AMP phosphodiesterase CpdA